MMPSPPLAARAAQARQAANTPQAADAAATPQITASVATGLDSSGPEAFIRSVAPYAERVSKATGIPAEALIGMACNETGYGRYAPGNNLFGIKGSGPAGTFSTRTWEDYGNGPVTITDNFRAYHSPAESFLDFAALVTTSPRYKGAVGQTTVAGFVDGLRQGGYMTDPDYVNKISAITTRYSSVIHESLQTQGSTSGGRGILVTGTGAPSAPPMSSVASAAVKPGAGVVVPDQFHIGLPAEEAYAACGPVAAIAFAQVYGRNPTPTEAMELAKQSGWTAAGGMNGISNEKRLLDKMGLPSQLEMGANWDHIRGDALQRQPVILSTPGHYFVIDGYDPNTGAYHVGQSGKAFRGGSDWLTPAQIQGLAGAPSGALFTVHPLAGQPTMQTREVLPPQPEVLAAQRKVLPPELTPPPPSPSPSPPPPAPPPAAPASAAPPPAPTPMPASVPPPTPVSAEPPTLIAPPPTAPPGLAVGAVAAAQKPTPPSTPRPRDPDNDVLPPR